jgi:hypothetical protein
MNKNVTISALARGSTFRLQTQIGDDLCQLFHSSLDELRKFWLSIFDFTEANGQYIFFLVVLSNEGATLLQVQNSNKFPRWINEEFP